MHSNCVCILYKVHLFSSIYLIITDVFIFIHLFFTVFTVHLLISGELVTLHRKTVFFKDESLFAYILIHKNKSIQTIGVIV